MQDRDINLTLNDINGFTQNFTSLRALLHFAKQERDVWQKLSDRAKAKQNVSDVTVNALSQLDWLVAAIDGWSESLKEWDDNQLQQQLNNLQQSCIRNINTNWLWSGQACAEPFIQCFEQFNAPTAAAFLNFVARKQVATNQNNVDSFNGAMVGYEFLNQESDIVKRRNGEKISLGRIRNSFVDANRPYFPKLVSCKKFLKNGS